MTIRPEGRLDNIIRSVNKHAQTNFAATFAEPNAGIEYHGQTVFDDAKRKEWLRVTVLEPARPAIWAWRRASTTADAVLRGQTQLILVQYDIFTRPALQDASVRANRLYTLRDVVTNVIFEHAGIAIVAYQSDSSSLGNMIVDRITLDRELTNPTERDDIQHYAIGCECRFLDRWSVS